MKEIEENLFENYNIMCELIEKNEESTDGNVYMIKDKQNIYVVKIYNDLVHTKAMVKIHNLLIENNLNVPQIIQNKDKNGYSKFMNDKYIVLYTFIDGKPINWDKETGRLDENIIRLFAKVLKKCTV